MGSAEKTQNEDLMFLNVRYDRYSVATNFFQIPQKSSYEREFFVQLSPVSLEIQQIKMRNGLFKLKISNLNLPELQRMVLVVLKLYTSPKMGLPLFL